MKAATPDNVSRFADMFAAMGTESRIRIMQQLIASHPGGMVVGEIQSLLGLSASNLSHHLDKLRSEGLIDVQREGTYLRCRVNVKALRQLLTFLMSECCTRSTAIKPQDIAKASR